MKYVVAQNSLRGVKKFLTENGINFISTVQRCNTDWIIDTSLSLHCFTAPNDNLRNYHQLIPESHYHKSSAFYEIPWSCLCILIVRPCILNVVYVFLLWSMYSYCSSMYSYCCLCILIVVYVFLVAATLDEVFPCFFLGCKANARVILAKTGQGPLSSKLVVLFYVLFVLYCSIYCLCVNVYCHRVTTQLQLTNI